MTVAPSFPVKLAPLFCALLLAASACIAAPETKSVRVGESWVTEFEGNPSTGYKWRLDEGGSENLSSVKVVDLGYGEPPPSDKQLVGRPAPYRFRIISVAPGFAKLHFEYVQPWVGQPEQTNDVWVRVAD